MKIKEIIQLAVENGYTNVVFRNGLDDIPAFERDTIFLDPLFWKALTGERYKLEMISFMGHIADGKSAEEFFKTF